MLPDDIRRFIADQLAAWLQARQRHEALSGCLTAEMMIGMCPWRVTFNPSRASSTQAPIAASYIASRPCFLCRHARPGEQRFVEWRDYDILVNPYPVFPGHLTIASRGHVRQELAPRLADMMALAGELEGYTVFYNGPHSGASAPDHCHFQAVPESYLPIARRYPVVSRYFCGTPDEVEASARAYIDTLPKAGSEYEPRLNAAVRRVDESTVEMVVIPRRAHRPSCYDTLMISPGAIDMLGCLVATRHADFDAARMRANAEAIMADVAFPSEEPTVDVGIMSAPNIDYSLHGRFDTAPDGTLLPQQADAWFELRDVTIGVGFHWQQRLSQRFRGALSLRRSAATGMTLAVNTVAVEEYLMSVISSEMSAEASLQLLKAHAVISRSWLLAQIEHRGDASVQTMPADTPDRHIRWYDREDHTEFHVCADDHCQRYQGIGRITRPEAVRAVLETAGEVLTYEGRLCDARFSKCCGGAMETFSSCWADDPAHPYLAPGRDAPASAGPLPDLTGEPEAEQWIEGRPDAFCSRADSRILRQVLNDFDLATTDFYRWSVSYGQQELSELVARRSGIDFGTITALRPLRRGVSGRITELLIEGTRRSITVGKELEIRRWLSESHLYSSAFTVGRTPDGGFLLRGAGWGHGAGLCQIGAAVMASEGYDYRRILTHYFHDAEISRRY